MAEFFQFPIEKQIERANRESHRDTFGVPYETPHDKALLHMELLVRNLIELLDMPDHVLNTLPDRPCWFTYDQPVTADVFFDILQSEIGRKRMELARARANTNKHNETENYAAE